jgi:hypothetical protein
MMCSHPDTYSVCMLTDTVISLILSPDPERIRDQDFRGEFCLRQNSKPLKYNICRPVRK